MLNISEKFFLIISGSVGSGKSTVGKILKEKFVRTAVFDMDDIKWQISDFKRGEEDNIIVREGVLALARNYCKHGINIIIPQTMLQQEQEKFKKLAIPYLNNNFPAIPENINLTELLKMEQERIRYLAEIGEGIKFFFTNELVYESKILIWKKSDQQNTKKVLKLLTDELKNYQAGDWQTEKLKTKIAKFIKDKQLTNGEILWPMRVALTGQEKSPPPFEVAVILGKEETSNRLQKALDSLG